MGLYGDSNIWGYIKRKAVGNSVVYTARFTTAGGSAPTIDTDKTRGVLSIARTGTGEHTITLPQSLRNVSVQVSRAGGTTAQLAGGDMTEGAATCLITTVTAGGSTAADSTGIIIDVVIMGTGR